MLKPLLFAALLAAAPLSAEPDLSAEVPAPGATAAESDPLAWVKSFRIDGFTDAYYKHNTNGIQGTGSTWRTFDQYQNQAAVGGGRLGLRSADGVLTLDLYLGDYAKVLAANTAPGVPVEQEQVHLGQAYLSQTYQGWSLVLGRYLTFVGFETVDSVANWNFTRGLIYAQEPFFHTGVKVAYSDPNGFSLLALVDNGNSNLAKPSEASGAGAQVAYTGEKGFFTANYYYEPVLTVTPRGMVWEAKHYLDAVAKLEFSPGYTFAAEYLYLYGASASDTNAAGDAIGTSAVDPETSRLVKMNPKSQGYAAYLDLSLPYQGWSFTPRYEAWYQPDAYRTDFSYTGTFRHSRGPLTNWLEVRSDVSSQPVFATLPRDRNTVPAPQPYSELTITWAVGYKF